MKIRHLQLYPENDLYFEYKKAYEKQEVFDAITIATSIYIEAGVYLTLDQFKDKCRRTKLYRYEQCFSFPQYESLKRQHISAVLPNRIVLTPCIDYNKDEFEQVLNGGFIRPAIKTTKNDVASFIYNSNMIEGIDVTYEDTLTILAGGTVLNMKYDDEIMVSNAKDAYDLRITIDGFVVDPYYMCKLHYELMKGVRDDAGRIRAYDVIIGNASHKPPSYDNVLCMLSKMKSFEEDDPIKLAALLHAYFVKIHPFGDGNGRIARLITHPYTNIPFESRMEYYMALDAYGLYNDYYALWSLLVSINNKDSKQGI